MIDVGAGDGRFVVATAASDADTFAVGVDANSAGLREGLRRARKAKLTNALFVAAAAEMLPGPLAGTATEVRVHFPWGSLLTSLLTGNRHVVNGIAALLRHGGRLTVLASVIERDGIEGLPRLDHSTAPAVASRVVASTDLLCLLALRPANTADLASARSTWGKRLGAGAVRPAWTFEFDRPDGTALEG